MAKTISQIKVGGETYLVGGGGGNVENALAQVSDMSTLTPSDGDIVQYVGATTSSYVHGGLYEYGANMTTFSIGANKAGIPQGTYRTKAAPTSTNIFASNYTGSDGNNYQGASQYNKLQVGDVAWNSSTYESFLITDVQDNGETLTLENGVTATYTNSTSGGSAQVYEIDGYYFLVSDSNSIVSRAGVTSRSGFIILSDVGSAFNNYSTAVVSGWFQIAQIGAGNVTVKKQGSTVQTFNVNQQWNTIIDLPDDVRMAHFNNGKAFIVEVIECEQINGEFFDPQELIDNPDDPRPFIPIDGEYYYSTNLDRVYSYDDYEGVVDVTDSVLISGNPNVLYVDVDTNQSFRYNGTAFVKITDSSKADDVPTFTEAATRSNLVGSGESTLTLWGKIKKWFTDLKAVAFSGSYNDLSNKPLSVENSKVKYTLSDGTTKLTLAQESDVKNIGIDFTPTAVTGRVLSGDPLSKSMKILSNLVLQPYSAWNQSYVNNEAFCQAFVDYLLTHNNHKTGNVFITTIFWQGLWLVTGTAYNNDTNNNPTFALFVFDAVLSNVRCRCRYNSGTWSFSQTEQC